MVIFVIRSLKFLLQARLSFPIYRGRKVRTAQSNAPVNSRVADVKVSKQKVPQKITTPVMGKR